MTILNRTQNGKVFKCGKCNAIHIEFRNLNFNFTQRQYNHFMKYIHKLDGAKWEAINKDILYERKIVVPVHEYLNMLLNLKELMELKTLLRFSEQKTPSKKQTYRAGSPSFSLINLFELNKAIFYNLFDYKD